MFMVLYQKPFINVRILVWWANCHSDYRLETAQEGRPRAGCLVDGGGEISSEQLYHRLQHLGYVDVDG